MPGKIARIKGLIEWREMKLAENSKDDPRAVFWREDIEALQSAVESMERNPARDYINVPQGLWSDHHEAIHAECEWDWAGALESVAQRRRESEEIYREERLAKEQARTVQ